MWAAFWLQGMLYSYFYQPHLALLRRSFTVCSKSPTYSIFLTGLSTVLPGQKLRSSDLGIQVGDQI